MCKVELRSTLQTNPTLIGWRSTLFNYDPQIRECFLLRTVFRSRYLKFTEGVYSEHKHL